MLRTVVLSLVLAVVPHLVPRTALAQGDERPVGEIMLQGRDALDVVVRAPFRDARSAEGRTASVRLIDAIDKALRARTTLFAREAKESKNLIDAKGDTIAILKAVRSDVDLARLAREGKQIDDHNRERRALGERPARMLVVITIVPQGDKNRISLVLVDADEGLDLLLDDQGRASPEALDQRFQETAVVGTPAPAVVGTEDEAVAYIERLFTRDLRPVLESSGVWGELGTIDLRTTVADAEIRLDGTLVGTTRAGLMRMHDAPPGPHSLELAASGYAPFEQAIQVSAGDATVVLADLEPAGSVQDFVRGSTFWGGVGAAVAGTAVLAWGMSLSLDHSTGYACIPRCVGGSWVRAGRDVDPSDGVGDVTGSGPALLPLGYSLLLTGAVWTLGPELFEPGSDIPWWSIAIGLSVGVLTYSLSEILESRVAP